MSEPNIYRYINEEQEQLHAAKNNPGVNGCAPFPWHEQPILNKDGNPKALLANTITALRLAPPMGAGPRAQRVLDRYYYSEASTLA